MSIRFRLTLLYTTLLIVVIGLFGAAVFFLFRASLMDDVDRDLARVAVQMHEQTSAFVQGNTAVISLPAEELDVFRSSTTFFVILNDDGRVMHRSANMGDYSAVLDPNGRRPDETYATVVHGNQPLRVLSEPLYLLQPGEERQLIGHLQVAQVVDNEAAVMQQLGLILLLTGLAAACLSLFLGAVLANYMLKPLDEIIGVAVQITHTNDLSRRLPDHGRRDEIGRLTLVLNQTLERLERLFHARQRFLADVSHELRTPLTTIRGNVDLMRRMGEADPELLAVVVDELERMTRLVDDLLLLARADSGSLPMRREPVALDVVFLDVYRQVSSIAQPVQVTLREVDQVSVKGDPDRLKQLILNLVDNAIKYTPPGGQVTMGLAKINGTATIEITDTGIGIQAEDQARIFDRFYRVDKARSRGHGGSGLGLSIAMWIAQSHGGDIQVESELGKGSTFRIALPLLESGPAPARQAAARGRLSRPRAVQKSR